MASISTRSATSADDTAAAATTGTTIVMVGAPLLICAAELLSPINDATDTSAARVADILEHSGRYTVSVVCLVIGMLSLVPAVRGLRRGALGGDDGRAGRVGTALAATGFMLFAVASGALGVGPSAWSGLDDPARRETLVEAFDAMDRGQGAMPIAQWGPLLSLVGLVAVSVALWRTTSYPRWASLAVSFGWAMFLLTPAHLSRAAGSLVLLAGFMPVVLGRARR